jgi:Xaa-Pro aminopeptidase
MFEPSVYKARRDALVARMADRGVRQGLALFVGNRESPVNYPDNAYPFRQDSSFLYFFGLAESDLAATLDLGSGGTVLYADELSMDDLVWTGPRPTAAELAAVGGIDCVRPRAALADYVAGRRSGGEPLFLPPYRAETKLELAALLGAAPNTVSSAASAALIRSVIALREIKEPREVARIEQAVDTTIDMHRAVIHAARAGMQESALMAEAYRVAYSNGLPSFPAIATTKGAILHNHGYSGTLADGGLFLLDAGAETPDGYAGDLTSTFPISGHYDSRQAAIYRLVLDAGKVGSSMLKPGLPYRDAHFAAARVLASGLKELGIMHGDVDEAVAAGAHACFFPHGLGHQMGLDVHDMEGLGELLVGYDGEARSTQFGLKSLRMAKPLRAGMVMTVEPGLYFIPGLIAAWKAEHRHDAFINWPEAERWADFGGVRNEEDWLVVADGARRLGGAFDKSVVAMEGYRA